MIKIKEHGFRYRGLDIKIHPLARIVKPEVIEIDDFAMVDDFAFINGGAGIKIGKYVHIGSFASVVGGGVARGRRGSVGQVVPQSLLSAAYGQPRHSSLKMPNSTRS